MLQFIKWTNQNKYSSHLWVQCAPRPDSTPGDNDPNPSLSFLQIYPFEIRGTISHKVEKQNWALADQNNMLN